jgi:hypothetical protein
LCIFLLVFSVCIIMNVDRDRKCVREKETEKERTVKREIENGRREEKREVTLVRFEVFSVSLIRQM